MLVAPCYIIVCNAFALTGRVFKIAIKICSKKYLFFIAFRLL